MARPVTYANGQWYVDVSDVNELAERLAKLAAGELSDGFAAGNKSAAEYVAGRAKGNATDDRQQSVVANDPRAFFTRSTKATGSVVLRGGKFAAATGNKHDPLLFAFGSEFGAAQDKTRRVRTLDKVAKAQGRVKRKPGRPARGSSSENYFGGFRVMKGWNQFDPWRGSSNTEIAGVEPGYWLWPAVRDSRPHVTDIYGQSAMAAIREQLDKPTI